MRTSIRRYTDTENTLKVDSFYHITATSDIDPWHFMTHCHNDMLELSLIISGETEFDCDHVKYDVVPGDMVIANAGTLHSEYLPVRDDFEQYTLDISGVHVPDMPPDTLVPDSICPVIHTGNAFDYLKSMMAYLYGINSDPSIASSDLTKQTIENLISITDMLVMNESEEVERESYSQLVSEALEYIESHISEAMSLDCLSKLLYISPYHLAHKFKSEVGCTVNQYILDRKLGYAEDRLVFSTKPIKEIASDCGYDNLQYFYSVFKKHTGNTPAEVRNYCLRARASSI